MPRSIAKVNSRSIDGYFGEGTSCFFIRGTVLSDTAVGGEYLTLSFNRAGNTITIEAFDGLWAVVTIETRIGNRPGDNVRARLYLRDDDLKALGVDCEKILAINGLPFAFAVETLANNGLFELVDPEVYEPVEDDPPPPVVMPREPDPEPVAWVEPEPEPEPEPAVVPAPEAAMPEPEVVAAHLEPEPVLEPRAADAEVLDPMPADATPQERIDLLKLVSSLRAGRAIFGGNPLLEIGASVAAVATPVVLYLLLAFIRNKPPGDDKH
jgi:hypothetical protein